MSQRSKKINNKLLELGQRLGLDGNEALTAKRTIKNVLSVAIAVGIIAIIGLLVVNRLDVAGKFYMPPGIKDFSILGRLL